MRVLIPLISVFITTSIYGQGYKNELPNERAKCVFGELGSNGLAFSANYDTRVAKKQNGFGARAGIGIVPTFFVTAVTFPFGLNYLSGKGPHYLESGAGATLASLAGGFLDFNENKGATTIIFVPSLGYRYQPLKNGFTARVVVSPLIGSGEFQLWGGLSAGYKF